MNSLPSQILERCKQFFVTLQFLKQMKENITLSGDLLEEKLNTLKKVGVDDSGWLTYYLDETSGEKWIKDYPNSERHGGGLPVLRLLKKFPWE